MPGRALPDTAKSRKKTEAKAQKAREVAAIYNDSNDDRKLRQLEIDFGINKDTIQRYAKDPDRKDRIQAAVEKLLLTEDK
jgi:hypothetical protein